MVIVKRNNDGLYIQSAFSNMTDNPSEAKAFLNEKAARFWLIENDFTPAWYTFETKEKIND